MKSIEPLKQQLLQAIRGRMIPWLSMEGAIRLILAEPPIIASPGVTFREYRPPLPKVPRVGRPSYHEYVWPEQKLGAVAFPAIGCVLEGEADLVFGPNVFVPPHPTTEAEVLYPEVWSFPEKTLFVLPAGVPRTMGRDPHWERPQVEQAYSRVLWLLTLPWGAFCHICFTRGPIHGSDGALYVEDRQLEPILQLLIEEMRVHSLHCEEIVRHFVWGLLLRVERDLNTHPMKVERHGVLPPLTTPYASQLVRDVCQYIHQRLSEPLTLSSIAFAHHISPSQLNRRFNAEIEMSVMQYVTHARMEMAKHLLTHADYASLSIREIGRMVGFTETSYFARVFQKHTHISPVQFRERHREAVYSGA
ncbi:MAG TPA: AraC family transcriptional regulator [Chthonomonadales bacterium]|nr:AraC family transcriptional regulator [Chthonomonadales bacterium]